MPTTFETLEQVLIKARYIMATCNDLQENNNFLKKENERLTAELLSKEKRLADAALKSAFLQASVKSTDPDNSFEFNKKITDFVQEIDKCIVLLNK